MNSLQNFLVVHFQLPVKVGIDGFNSQHAKCVTRADYSTPEGSAIYAGKVLFYGLVIQANPEQTPNVTVELYFVHGVSLF